MRRTAAGRFDQRHTAPRRIYRGRRPTPDGAEPKRFPAHELFAVTEVEGGPNDWKRVGVAFTNKDESLSLIVDDGVRDGAKARFQMRVRRDAQPSEASPQTQTPSSRAVVRKREAA